MLGLALIVLPAINGNLVASAHDKSNRSRYSGDDDDRYDHQRRERDRLRRHQRIEDAQLRRHQIEERFRYGDSWRLREHQRREWENNERHQRREKNRLKGHQRYESYHDDHHDHNN